MDLFAVTEKSFRNLKLLSVAQAGMLSKLSGGGEWDPILDMDEKGKLVKRMGEVVDGQYQKFTVESGAYFRHEFFGGDPELLKMV